MSEQAHIRALDQLMADVHRSVERFRGAMLRAQQTRFWTEHRQVDATEHPRLETQYAYEERLTSKICEAMQDVLEQALTPMAQTIMERIPVWARDERERVQQRSEEKQLTPTLEVTAEGIAPAPPSWREAWRARHGITSPSRSAGHRHGTHQAVTEEQTHAQRY